MRRTPALIVGGGPAGAAVAIRLAEAGKAHLLVERQVVVQDSLCGGFLSWRTLDALARLGIDADALNPSRIDSVRLFAGTRMADARLPRPGLAVSRRRLDTLLIERAIAVGASIERGIAVRSIERHTAYLADGGAIAGEALFLASGKHDVRGLARPADARGADPTLGLRTRLAPTAALTRLVAGRIELHLFARGYAGLALQEDGSANLCLAVHRSRLDAAGSPAALIAELGREAPALGERLADWSSGAAIDAVANVPYGWREKVGMPGLFRLGDQAGVIPSLAGEGMGIALASGLSAAAAYVHGGSDAAAAWQRRFARELGRPIGAASLVRRLAESRWAPALLPLLRPALIQIIAKATRVGHSAP